uniref:Uncharacterized protein n=1 Tax=Siphoviridae sp. ctRcp9 TaxID=2825504 RepID=A0A8S5PLY9_9CAUD|nr:MAG TPA: hypothetical protein [Siphoviridae sp. ctRcp9]
MSICQESRSIIINESVVHHNYGLIYLYILLYLINNT